MGKIKSCLVWGGLGLAFVGLTAIKIYRTAPNKFIPTQEQIQQGYVAPSRIEILCKDLDGNDKLETLMKINGNSYLLREINGKPTISAYEIKPAEIIIK